MSFPTTIKAVALSALGDFDVIKDVEVPFPKPAQNEILVKVAYSGINFIDNYFRTGIYPVTKFPHVVGVEASGTIVSLPTDSSITESADYKKRNFKVGAKVSVASGPSAAEYVSVDWAKVFVVPDNVSLDVAAAANAQGSTALTFVQEAYNVKAGDTILVHTVAGGLGLLFTQLAKLRGATVIGTTSTPEKAEIAKANGADHVILYKQEDTAKRVLEITNGEGVDVVYDGVGKDTYEIDFEVIKRKGTIVFVGNASGVVPPISPLRLAAKNIKLLRPTVRNYIFTAEEFRHYFTELYDLISQQKLKILIHKVYPFNAEGVQQAEKDLTGGKTVGKLLIKVSDD
ncbi:NAD(P)-binding protein [Abortiporus biennis]|nr:NAD(P)-binding protein [Abortiporus biennis]